MNKLKRYLLYLALLVTLSGCNTDLDYKTEDDSIVLDIDIDTEIVDLKTSVDIDFEELLEYFGFDEEDDDPIYKEEKNDNLNKQDKNHTPVVAL